MKFSGQIFIFSILKTFTEIVFVITTFFPHSLFGQLHEDFSDNEIALNPPWGGSTTDFVVTDSVLQLKAGSLVTSAYLSTAYEPFSNTRWEFYVHLSFNPSASNYARVYLSSDQANLQGPLNGYFVMIGNTADEISLYRQTGTTKTKILDGVDGKLNLGDVLMKIKVTRDMNGVWELWSDVGLTSQFELEGTVTDNINALTGYFGFQCVFTSTRADKFFFDEIQIDNIPIKDTTAPTIDSLIVISGNEIQIVFNEPVQIPSEVESEYFLVNNNIGHPQSVTITENQTTLLLSFFPTFTKNLLYTLQVQPVSDHSGNFSTISTLDFAYSPVIQAQWKDIIVTEIFADPTPVLDLPEAEYIEVYNRTSDRVSVKNWIVSDGSSVGKIPEFILNPRDYVVLASANNKSIFEKFGHVIGVQGFPSLNNSGDAIIIRNDSGVNIDSVFYTENWYGSSTKQSGGWSLELIDTENLCSDERNWVVSNDETGGTPGKINSVAAEKPDLMGPKLSEAYYLGDTLVLSFDEKLNEHVPLLNNFNITPEVHIKQVIPDKYLRKIKLIPALPLSTKVLYKIEVNGLYDCPGNLVQSCCNSLEFALPEEADSLEVVINEILFNPRVNGIDFVEIFNASDKFIDLKGWKIGNLQNGGGEPQSISLSPVLLKPGGYLVFTTDPAVLANEYPKCFPENLIKAELSPFNDDSGAPGLMDSNGRIIDSFTYHSGMHSVFISNEEGVSLERLSVHIASSDNGNWKSATSSCGYATPGYVNSNAVPEFFANEEFFVEPEVFQPVYGQPDFAKIAYRFNVGQYMCTIRIFDYSGHLVKTVAENILLGTEGFFRWEGDRDDGTKSRIGNYMVWIELYDSEGVVKRIRKRVALSSGF